MIPIIAQNVQSDLVNEELPSKTYRFDTEMQSLAGVVDGLEAVRQAIYLCLSIERYENLIYSWNYGVELKDLVGKDATYIIPELSRRVPEALLQDTRITGINDIDFDISGKSISMYFSAATIYGVLNIEKVVNL